jgi:hypothetical protein
MWTGRLDTLKYVRLSDSRDGWFLTLGAALRGRFESFTNTHGSAANGTDGFLLQRSMVLADLHLGRRFRVFTQLKSGLVAGRKDGPRPPDEDRLDVRAGGLDPSRPPVLWRGQSAETCVALPSPGDRNGTIVGGPPASRRRARGISWRSIIL